MNEFARKALELADEAAEAKSSLDLSMTEVWRSEAYRARLSKQLDEARAALVAHLEGVEQKWIRVEDRLPEPMTMVLAAFEMDRPGDWRVKCASYEPLCHEFSIVNQKGWRIFGGGWTPTHWIPLPATPTEEQP
jgi:hypothetical protein